MSDDKPNYPPIRRIVTGHDGEVAKVLIDAPASNAKYPGPGTVSTLIWTTDKAPAEIATGTNIEDMGARIMGTAPPAHGSRFAVIDFPPGNTGRMHRTETIDYVIVISGEIDMEMDGTTIHLKAGDVLVQRGTIHNWINRGTAPCVIAFVLIDAKPVTAGGKVLEAVG